MKPTPGAMKAADIIFDKHDNLTPAEMAKIIDEETKLPELIGLAENVEGLLSDIGILKR